MGKKKKKEDFDDEIINSLPNLYMFFVKWKEIDWGYEYVGNQRILFLPGKLDNQLVQNLSSNNLCMQGKRTDNIVINSVAGFTNSGALRQHMNIVFLNDFSSLKKHTSSFPKPVQIKILESIMGQMEDLKCTLIGEYQYNGSNIKIFKRWTTTATSPAGNTDTDCIILHDSESFVMAFLSGVDDIIAKLRYSVAQLEGEDSDEDDPLTFRYVGHVSNQERLNDLFDDLIDSGFILNDRTYIYDFKRIFSGKVKRRKIVWTTYLEDLYWFISLLKKNNQLENPGKLWIKTCYCFAYQDPNTEIAVTQLSGAHKPSRAKEIEDLLHRTLLLGNRIK